MKPKTAPASLDWHELPTFDSLRDESKIKVSALRLKLSNVPCWRCPDNSVRYDLEAAEAAIADTPGVVEQGEGAITPLTLLDKQIRINAETAKQHTETLRAMGEPLKAGVEMWGLAWDRQEKRLSQLEGTFDRMIAIIEVGLTNQHDRDLATKKHEASVELRGKTFTVVKEQLPTIVSKWAMTKKATAAVSLVDSLDERMIQALVDSDVLSEEQVANLETLRPGSTKGKPPPAAPPNGTTEH